MNYNYTLNSRHRYTTWRGGYQRSSDSTLYSTTGPKQRAAGKHHHLAAAAAAHTPVDEAAGAAVAAEWQLVYMQALEESGRVAMHCEETREWSYFMQWFDGLINGPPLAPAAVAPEAMGSEAEERGGEEEEEEEESAPLAEESPVVKAEPVEAYDSATMSCSSAPQSPEAENEALGKASASVTESDHMDEAEAVVEDEPVEGEDHHVEKKRDLSSSSLPTASSSEAAAAAAAEEDEESTSSTPNVASPLEAQQGSEAHEEEVVVSIASVAYITEEDLIGSGASEEEVQPQPEDDPAEVATTESDVAPEVVEEMRNSVSDWEQCSSTPDDDDGSGRASASGLEEQRREMATTVVDSVVADVVRAEKESSHADTVSTAPEPEDEACSHTHENMSPASASDLQEQRREMAMTVVDSVVADVVRSATASSTALEPLNEECPSTHDDAVSPSAAAIPEEDAAAADALRRREVAAALVNDLFESSPAQQQQQQPGDTTGGISTVRLQLASSLVDSVLNEAMPLELVSTP